MMQCLRLMSDFKYQEVLNHILGLIEKGRYKPGDRLPSVRQISRQLKVSLSTVTLAYSTLENDGIIEIRPQSGCYVSRENAIYLGEPEKSKPQVIVQWVDITDVLNNVATASLVPDIVPFGMAAPHPDLIPYQELNRILSGLCRENDKRLVYYDFPPGDYEFRAEIVKRAALYGCNLFPEDVVVTSGALEALNIALKTVCNAGDIVAIESPTYYCLLKILESYGLQALEIPTDPVTGMDLDILEASIQKYKISAITVIPNFNNPMGFVMNEENKKRLAEMAVKYQIPVIEDDIYGDLSYDHIRPKPIKAFDQEGWVLTCGSFSKSLIPAYRAGWCIPGRFTKAFATMKWMSSASNAPLPVAAVTEFLKRGSYDKHLRRFRKNLAVLNYQVTHAIQQYFPNTTRVTRPRGGYLLWLELPQQVDAFALYRKALESHISISPGPLFSASGQYQNFIRINCCYPWTDEIDQAFQTLGQFVKELM